MILFVILKRLGTFLYFRQFHAVFRSWLRPAWPDSAAWAALRKNGSQATARTKRQKAVSQCLHWLTKAPQALSILIQVSLSNNKNTRQPKSCLVFLVRERRLELPRRLTHAPQTCLSTCSSTLAYSPAHKLH